MADPSVRWTLRAHGPSVAASALVFGGDAPLLRPPTDAAGAGVTVGTACCGPEVACRQTATGLGWAVEVLDDLRGPDLGRWTGRSLVDVAEADPAGVAAWSSDPDARPHGGESLTALVTRVGAVLGRSDWPGSRALWVATPLVVRALAVAALGAPPALLLALDVSYGGELLLSGRGRRWRLQGLTRSGGVGTVTG